jgi:hypothetical protein
MRGCGSSGTETAPPGANWGGKTMDKYKITYGNDETIVFADMNEASAAITYEDCDGNIRGTPYQTADGRHRFEELVPKLIHYIYGEWPEDGTYEWE